MWPSYTERRVLRPKINIYSLRVEQTHQKDAQVRGEAEVPGNERLYGTNV